MNTHKNDRTDNFELLKLERILLQWETYTPNQRKLSKKEKIQGGDCFEEKLSFSILKDAQGNYYRIDNDPVVTKSEESYGANGKYRRLFLIKRAPQSNQRNVDVQIGTKIIGVMEVKPQPIAKNNCSVFSLFAPSPVVSAAQSSFDIEDDIFGKRSPVQKCNEIEALKLTGLYLEDFIVKNKHYILMQHIPGKQLLKYIQTEFATLKLTDQINAFANILKSCINSLHSIHAKNIAHGDAQLKNFIKVE